MVWDKIESIISVFGSLASLIALPIAIWQVVDLKKQVKSSLSSFAKLSLIVEQNKMDVIKKSLDIQQDNIISIMKSYSQQGVKWSDINESVTSIIREINHAERDLPTNYTEEANALRETVKKLLDFLSCDPKSRKANIQDAELSLHGCIQLIKRRIEDSEDKKLEIITNAR